MDGEEEGWIHSNLESLYFFDEKENYWKLFRIDFSSNIIIAT